MKGHAPHLFLMLALGITGTTTAGTTGDRATKGFYINLGMGGIFSSTSDSFTANSNSLLYSPTAIGTSLFTLPNVNWRTNFNNGFDFNASVGKNLNEHFRYDLEFLYQNIERDSDGSYGWLEQNSTTGAVYAQQSGNLISKVAGRANIYSFLTNLSYDFDSMGQWHPLLGVGVGISWLSAGSIQTNNTINIDDPNTPLIETASALQNSPSLYGTAFAWQFKAGIAYPVSEIATATLQYRLYGTTEFRGSSSSIIASPGSAAESRFYVGEHAINALLIHAVELTMRFNV